jgi:hypothetical protein
VKLFGSASVLVVRLARNVRVCENVDEEGSMSTVAIPYQLVDDPLLR